MTAPYYADDLVTLHLGDCLDVLAGMEPASIDAVVCDPPYGLEFMGKDWDAPWRGGINADAGFEPVGFKDGPRLPRPTYTGSTNPLCLNCGGNKRGRRDGTAVRKVCTCDAPRFPNVRAVEMRAFQEWCGKWAAECLRVLKPGGYLAAFGGTRTWHRLACAIEDTGFEYRNTVADLTGIDGPGLLWMNGQGFPKSLNVAKAIASGSGRPEDIRRAAMGDDYEPSGRGRVNYDHGSGSVMNGSASAIPLPPEAARWEGWGTDLKPAWEPVVVARKPLNGPVTANVLRYGTGALNIGGCLVGAEERVNNAGGASSLQRVSRVEHGYRETVTASRNEDSEVSGRWPPNVLLGEEAAAELDRQSGSSVSRIGKPRRSAAPGDGYGMTHTGTEYADSGGASRFFPVFRYEAKAPASERHRLEDGTAHNTVKPVALMRWLVRLVTPPGGTVLDPFAGSGTTGEACIIEGFRSVLVERDAKYAELIATRLRKPIQPDLFGGAA